MVDSEDDNGSFNVEWDREERSVRLVILEDDEDDVILHLTPEAAMFLANTLRYAVQEVVGAPS